MEILKPYLVAVSNKVDSDYIIGQINLKIERNERQYLSPRNFLTLPAV